MYLITAKVVLEDYYLLLCLAYFLDGIGFFICKGDRSIKAYTSEALEEFMKDPYNRLEFSKALARGTAVDGEIILTDPIAQKNWEDINNKITAREEHKTDWYGWKSFIKQFCSKENN